MYKRERKSRNRINFTLREINFISVLHIYIYLRRKYKKKRYRMLKFLRKFLMAAPNAECQKLLYYIYIVN